MRWIFATPLIAAALLAQTAAAATFTVNTTSDSHSLGFVSQGAPGSTAATDSGGHTSLRSALEFASTAGGASTINLPSGTYNLSLGDLVVGVQAGTTIYVHGQGTPSDTTIHQSQSKRMVFLVNYNVNANVVFTLDNVTVSGGNEDSSDPDGFGGSGGAILAGGSSGAAGNGVTLNNVVFTGNSTSGNASGGALAMTGGGDLTVSGCTFTNNQAGVTGGGAGGAIYFNADFNPGTVTITGSIFTNNIATGTSPGQGGAIYLASGSGNTFTISQCTLTGNSAGVRGGAIDLETGHLTATFNRVTGNSAPTASGIYVVSGGWADARNNWWGANGGANATGGDATFPTSDSSTPLNNGQIALGPWLTLTQSANPSTISGPGGNTDSSTLTASFLTNSTGQTLTGAQVSALAGVSITFNNAVRGSLSSAQSSIQSSGTATATFTATSAGTGSADATVDHQTVTANINIVAATILGRYVFYNHSAWDGNTAGASAQDDGAIATDKQALISGGIASIANYTSYARGLNGIMIDFAGFPATPGMADFAFKMGNDNSPSTWAAAPTPSSLAIRAGAGAGGSDRLTLIWNDSDLTAPLGANEAVTQQWLQIRVKADANTGLAADDIFYFGNAVGEGNVGNTPGTFPVTSADALQALNHLNALGAAPITDVNDHNRDKKVTAEDALISLNNQSGLAPLIQLDLSNAQPQSVTSSDPRGAFAGGFLGTGKTGAQPAEAWIWTPDQTNPTLFFTEDLGAPDWQPVPTEWLRPVGGGILKLTLPTTLNQGFIRWSDPAPAPAIQ